MTASLNRQFPSLSGPEPQSVVRGTTIALPVYHQAPIDTALVDEIAKFCCKEKTHLQF